VLLTLTLLTLALALPGNTVAVADAAAWFEIVAKVEQSEEDPAMPIGWVDCPWN